jgi:hypothetical protein
MSAIDPALFAGNEQSPKFSPGETRASCADGSSSGMFESYWGVEYMATLDGKTLR